MEDYRTEVLIGRDRRRPRSDCLFGVPLSTAVLTAEVARARTPDIRLAATTRKAALDAGSGRRMPPDKRASVTHTSADPPTQSAAQIATLVTDERKSSAGLLVQ